MLKAFLKVFHSTVFIDGHFPPELITYWHSLAFSSRNYGNRVCQWQEAGLCPTWRTHAASLPFFIRRCLQCSILIQVKPGFWLLNLFNQVPKTWQNVWKWTSLVWMTTRTLMFMPSQKNLGWLPSLLKDHPYFGKEHSSWFIQFGRTPWTWHSKRTY